MKNAAAGLLVAMGCLGICSRALAEPSARPAGKEAAQAKTTALRGEQRPAEPTTKTTPSVESGNAPLTLFTAADRDHDGAVTYSELAAVVRNSISNRIQARFQQLDLNHDGRCVRGEVNKMSAARFLRFDLNRDGAFTSAELTNVMIRETTLRLQQVYARLDANRDGRFSVAELTPRPKQQPAVQVARVNPDPGRKTVDVAKRASSFQ